MRQRVRRAGSAGAVVLVGLVVFGVPTVAMAAPPDARIVARLTVNPSHGRSNAPLVATFRASGTRKCPTRAVFTWDARPIAEADFRACVVAVRFTPPGNDRDPGLHDVGATAGGAFTASAVYLVDAAVISPSPTVSPSPDPSPTAAPTTDAPSPTQALPTPTPTADDAQPTPDVVASTPALAVPAPAAPVVKTSGTGWTAWAFTGGAALILVGALALGLLVLSLRRRPAVAPPDADAVVPTAVVQTMVPRPSPGAETPTVEHPRQP